MAQNTLRGNRGSNMLENYRIQCTLQNRLLCHQKWQPTPVFLLWKLLGQRNLVGYSRQSGKESDMTERLIWPDTVMCLVTHTYPTLCKPIDCSLPESSVCGDCPGKNKYWSGLLSLPLEIFSTQGSSPGLLYCTCIIYQLSYQGSPFIVNYIVSQKILFWHIPIWKEQYSPIWLANSQESKDYLK